MFSKILIANRGEIAVRVIRTAQRMGVSTVAIYSEADREAWHAAMADEAYEIGPPPAAQSYLDIAKVIAVAKARGAEAIHPGYGFLSENAGFAAACAEAGMVFIGPPPSAIRSMGGKSEAKALMADAGVPVVPGYHGEEQADDRLSEEAAQIGYPVLIKASAGGGGKGMRVAATPEMFLEELEGAKREALSSFGDARMLLEKYLLRPRHVEVQVFADSHGNCYSLFERDCSIQRRHQKVIEEAPAPGLSDELRRRMGQTAVAAALAIGYVGAGTVEFLLDGNGDFYFMEMNTRLQVEHPVTEFITGLDLVEWQLRVAAGEALPAGWANLDINGHAIEARLYAEDPANGFLPSTGPVSHLRLPEAGPNLRIDSGIREGDQITVHYDPMIAKLVVWDLDRISAVRRLSKALAEVAICGVANNAGFLERLTAQPEFAAAELDTGFIERHERLLFPVVEAPQWHLVAMAALGLLLSRRAEMADTAARSIDPYSPWADMSAFRLNASRRERLDFSIGGQRAELQVVHGSGAYLLELEGKVQTVEGKLEPDGSLHATFEGIRRKGFFFRDGKHFELVVDGLNHCVAVVDNLDVEIDEAHSGGLASPMPGIIRAILAKPGEAVEKGRPLVVMEAMKMEHTVRAPSKGVVASFNCAIGTMVEAGALLVVFEPEA
ncbi:acetyl/propionyl/methylcrotonyl-CoA carboxylase subunit alpha [Rhizobium sp. KVB221]|uniref:Acetyl/propionyl/methylcrotonyl-CoA carboxylase subunit alpha n=1 Tax=Rhizobium setariae TaxID=2801340 RepID=A0A937CQ30_9HYPH|nr:acetyl/propionyl/methylcrotonyl-CoA carboxylase subunit alpha [Rhizobium setariae]MBL0373298.1 acetyl/propionyl/methylcrotonyl-CoA carboxylase subunit alpha [Rhizobium setariae]